MIASTPAAASTFISSGSSTVHTSTRRSCGGVRERAVRRRQHRRRRSGCSHRGHGCGRPRPRLEIGPVHEEPGGQLGRVRRAPRRRLRGRRTRPRRRARRASHEVHCRARHRVSGSASGSHREHFTSTFTSQPRARVERFGQRRHHGPRGADLGERLLRGQTEPFDRGVVVHDRTPSAVRRTSSSTPSAPSSRARAKAASVFSRARRLAPRWASTSGGGGMRSEATPENPKDATCSTFGARMTWSGPFRGGRRARYPPDSRCRIRASTSDLLVIGRTRPSSLCDPPKGEPKWR